MTTTPRPTAAEFAAALKTAELHAEDTQSHLHANIRRVMRCHVALAAQLAESERAREALRDAIEMRAFEWRGPHQGHETLGRPQWARDALAADQTTARESAENTAEETMTEQKCPKCQSPAPHLHPAVQHGGEVGVCPDAFHSTPTPENREPAPAQPPEPVEPSDEEAAYRAWDTPMRPKTGYDGFIAGYRAGLAAEAAKHEKAEVELGEMLQVAERARDDAKAELARVRAELEAMTTSHEIERDRRKRAEHAEHTMRAQARARRVPTREELRRVIRDELRHPVPASDNRTASEACADAVLRLFAEAPPIGIEELGRLLVKTWNDWHHNRDRTPCAIVMGRAAMTALGFQDSGGSGSAGAAEQPNKADEAPSGSALEDPAQPEPLVTSDNELPPTVTCTWAAYAGKNKVGCDQATDHPSGMCDQHRELAESFDRDVFTGPTPWKPTVGESAVLVASPQPVYVASRASVPARAEMWRRFRSEGHNITSSWIDEDGPGQTASMRELWARIVREVTASEKLVLYAETDDFPLKGALIEVGVALGLGKPVVVCLPGVQLDERSSRPLGSWVFHELVTRVDDVAAAIAWRPASAAPAKAEPSGYDIAKATAAESLPDLDAALANAKPAEPSPQPGGFLDALTRRVERIEAAMDVELTAYDMSLERGK